MAVWVLLLLAAVGALSAACGGDADDTDTGPAAPASVPTPRGIGELSAGAGPTPIPVTPTPVPTPTQVQTALYDNRWEGTYTLGDTTKDIVIEFEDPELKGEGTRRRKDEGIIDYGGIVMPLSFVTVGTSTVSFRVFDLKAQFDGELGEGTIKGIVKIGDVIVERATFEVQAK